MAMNFGDLEDVLRFLKENGNWDSVYEHSNALEVALTSQSIDHIFELITKDSIAPLIYESGCGSGVTTAQICSHLSERGIDKYRLVAHDVRKSLVELARNRFSDNDNVELELRSGSDYSDIPDESVDGVFHSIPWCLFYMLLIAIERGMINNIKVILEKLQGYLRKKPHSF